MQCVVLSTLVREIASVTLALDLNKKQTFTMEAKPDVVIRIVQL